MSTVNCYNFCRSASRPPMWRSTSRRSTSSPSARSKATSLRSSPTHADSRPKRCRRWPARPTCRETTFILPREPEVERERGVQVRIFTVQEELRFAGHPTLGTASWLYWNHPALRGAEQITLDLRVGPIPVRFTPAASRTSMASSER